MAMKFSEQETEILVAAVNEKIEAGKAKFEQGGHNFDALKALMTEIDMLEKLAAKLVEPPKPRKAGGRKKKNAEGEASAKATAEAQPEEATRQRKTA